MRKISWVLGLVLAVAGCGGAQVPQGEEQQTLTVTAPTGPATGAQPGEVWILHQPLTNIVYGTLSLSPAFDFRSQPVAANRVRVVLSGAQCGASLQAVNEASQPGQLLLQPMVPMGDGVFEGSGSALYLLQLEMYQTSWYPAATCMVDAYASTVSATGGGTDGGVADGGGTGGTGGVDVLTGWVNYTGGLVPRIDVAVTPAQHVSSFRVAVPSFCQVDIQNATVVTTEKLAPTKLEDATTRRYAVNNGAGGTISAVSLTLNGAAGTTCQIPVFITP
jgi:hypothetical protein